MLQPLPNRGLIVADNVNDKHKRAGTRARSQQEADAQVVREKTARLRELRLAHEAANKAAAGAASGAKRTTIKKKPRKSGEKALPLSEWLTTQEKEGRRR
jgi:hypothetical protein